MFIHPATYTAFFQELEKIALYEQRSPSRRTWDATKTIGTAALGFGTGTAAGLGVGHLADLISQKTTGRRVPHSLIYGIAPALGAAGGIAYAIHKATEQEALERALKNQAEPGAG
jgi:hypothetical protein